ncbi:MAG TPA: penicillin-binding protein activator [Dongiaceae bacterium]|nr:penicillin-binding protein activator [Dongiaceae bacterium]
MPRKLTTLACLSLVLALTACSSSQQPKPSDTDAPADPIAGAYAMVEKAEKLESPQAEKLLIDAANQFLSLGKLEDAGRILVPMDSSKLPAKVKADHVIALARLAMAQEKYVRVTELLTTDERGLISASDTLDAGRLNQISLLRAQAWEAQQNYLAAARERIFVSPMLSDADEFNRNHQQIWIDLISVPEDSLEQLSRTAAIPEIQGWLELAWIYKGQQDNIDQQLRDLRRWQTKFAGHPAAKQLPDSLRMLTEMNDQKPKNIALLLPLQGKYRQSAIAIQNGFMTAHYASAAKLDEGKSAPTVRVYDSTDIRNFMNVYRQAVTEGADIIVGPLQKENVHQLVITKTELPVPTIALNTDDTTLEAPNNLYQFGLSPEDDAREIANHARYSQFYRAAVLYQSSPWGERASSAFTEAWRANEGEITTSLRFESPQTLAATIKNLLSVDQSEARFRQLKQVVGKKVEFEPRRRQDIDFLYLVASPEQARLIKPLINFYYANDLPVYSGSQIYVGEPTPSKDRDLDGITFCDIPWMLDKPDKLKRSMLGAWPNANPRYFRLNALGADAYRLQARLHMLTHVGTSGLFGATGSLTIGPHNRIQRGLAWATMTDGAPRALPKVIDTEAMEQDENPGSANENQGGTESETHSEETGGESGGSTGEAIPATEGI